MQTFTPRLNQPRQSDTRAIPPMNPEQFWTSQDGQILLVKNQDERTVALTLAFWPRNPAEFEMLKTNLPALKFSERSSLARIGIEMLIHGPARVAGNRIELDADAFIYDPSFPNAPYWKKLLRVGAAVGRIFYAPAAAKLSTAEIWDAIKENQLKLPNTISIDRLGRVFLTSHQVSYTLNPKLQRLSFERIVSGNAGRAFLDKVQIRHDVVTAHDPAALGHSHQLLDVSEGALRGAESRRGQLRHSHERSAARPDQDLRDECHARDL